MICTKCDHDLEACECPDLEERFNSIKDSPYLHIGIEYQARILAHIHSRKPKTTANGVADTTTKAV